MFTTREKELFLACSTIEELRLFLDTYEINKFDEFGNTILHYYLKNIRSFSLDPRQVVLEIYNRGININGQSKIGRFRHTPLRLAMSDNTKDLFDLLLELGADVNCILANGNTILFDAIMQPGIVDKGYFIECILQKGADVYHKNNYGVSPISLIHNMDNPVLKKYFTGFEYTE